MFVSLSQVSLLEILVNVQMYELPKQSSLRCNFTDFMHQMLQFCNTVLPNTDFFLWL